MPPLPSVSVVHHAADSVAPWQWTTAWASRDVWNENLDFLMRSVYSKDRLCRHRSGHQICYPTSFWMVRIYFLLKVQVWRTFQISWLVQSGDSSAGPKCVVKNSWSKLRTVSSSGQQKQAKNKTGQNENKCLRKAKASAKTYSSAKKRLFWPKYLFFTKMSVLANEFILGPSLVV